MFSPKAQAQTPQTIDFYLHKLVLPAGELSEESSNSGTIDGNQSNFLTNYRGLNGVTFEVYDVSEAFYQLRATGLSVKKAQEQLAQNIQFGTPLATKITAPKDNENGVAQFKLPSKAISGEDAVYLFHEATASENIEEKATDLVVVLPVEDTAGNCLWTIHLYPKNEKNLHMRPALTKKIIGKKASYTYGETISFEIETQVPTDILDYGFYQITDQAEEQLCLKPQSLEVTIAGKQLTDLFLLSKDVRGFQLDFKDINALGNHAGETIKITYDMALNSLEVVDQDILNQVNLNTSYETVSATAALQTSGKHFIKVDLANPAKALAGAEFTVQNLQGQTLTVTETGYQWSDSAAVKTKVILRSAENGEFDIGGLAYGNYYLLEIKAPNGYERNKERIAFTVTDGSYESEKNEPLKIVNKQVSAKKTSGSQNASSYIQLPKTGNIDQKVWLFGGVILVTVSLMRYGKKIGGKKE